jgi:hypothetical protein
VAALDDQLADKRSGFPRERANRLGYDGHLAPAHGAVAFFGDDADGNLVVPPEYEQGSAPAAGGGARASLEPQLTREPPGVWPEVMTS